MASVYNHLSGKDVDEALLKLHGIKIEEIKEEKAGVKLCQRCGGANSILTHFCKRCNAPLDFKLILEVEEQKRKLNEFLRDFLVYYAEKDPKFKKPLLSLSNKGMHLICLVWKVLVKRAINQLNFGINISLS
jgi:ribosomal protein L40E